MARVCACGPGLCVWARVCVCCLGLCVLPGPVRAAGTGAGGTDRATRRTAPSGGRRGATAGSRAAHRRGRRRRWRDRPRRRRGRSG
ncbi:exported hypothetical protein [Frankia sp. AgKG'84/4]